MPLMRKPMLLLVLAVLMVTGCGSKPIPQIMQTGLENVILGPGDVVSVAFTYTPEHDITQTIRPDGRIVLEIVGEIVAAGKTPLQLRNDIMDKYKNDLKDYDIIVKVESLYSRRVYVGGEVQNPGVVDFPGELTALGAIFQSGGYISETAQLSKVKVIRQKEGQLYSYTINLASVLKGESGASFYLQPFDVVYVPKSKISRFNMFIDQYFNRVLPQIILTAVPFIIYNELFQD
jgi:protein involved in polysaccharide export with SLBB domain